MQHVLLIYLQTAVLTLAILQSHPRLRGIAENMEPINIVIFAVLLCATVFKSPLWN